MKTISTKVKAGAAGLFVVVAAFVAFGIWQQTQQISKASRVTADLTYSQKMSELALTVKDLRVDVVQVQQYL